VKDKSISVRMRDGKQRANQEIDKFIKEVQDKIARKEII
jgi:hypothetical protein